MSWSGTFGGLTLDELRERVPESEPAKQASDQYGAARAAAVAMSGWANDGVCVNVSQGAERRRRGL